jgi:hypothetical protein
MDRISTNWREISLRMTAAAATITVQDAFADDRHVVPVAAEQSSS